MKLCNVKVCVFLPAGTSGHSAGARCEKHPWQASLCGHVSPPGAGVAEPWPGLGWRTDCVFWECSSSVWERSLLQPVCRGLYGYQHG